MSDLILPPGVKSTGKGKKIAAFDDAAKQVQQHLNDIARLFKAPKLTLIVRSPTGGFFVTNDDTGEAIKVLVAEAAKETPASN